MSDAASDATEELFDDAEESLARLEDRLGGLDDLEGGLDGLADGMEEGGLKDVVVDLANLVEIVSEAEELLETIDFSELPDAVDEEELLEAIETGEIPDALAGDDSADVVKIRKLIRAINLAELWDAMDLRQFWTEKSELQDAVHDVTDDEDASGEGEAEDEGVVGEAVDQATDLVTGDDGESEGLVGEAVEAVTGGEDDEGMVEEAVDELEAGAMEAFGSAEGALEDGNLSEYQVLIQGAAMEGIEEFREALLVTHEKFQQLYEYNRERMRRTDKGTNSRNPTAVSTMPLDRADVGSTQRTTTVPQQVRYSTAPPMKRIYGRRFERELKKRRGELEERRSEREKRRGEPEKQRAGPAKQRGGNDG